MSFDSNADLWQLTPFGSEDENGQQNQQTDQGQQNNQQQAPPANNQGQQGNSESNEDDDPYAGLSAKELKKLLKDTESSKNATESEKKQLQDKIDAEERKKRTDLENMTAERDSEKETNGKLRESLSRQALINGILMDDRFTWHNIDDVIFKLPESVKVDDEGKVSGLTAALAKVAKDNEYLVKSTKDAQGNQQQNNGSNNNGPTGFQPGQGGANQGGGLPPNVTELAKNYPALASRGISGGYQAPQQPMPNQIAQ